VQKKSQSLSPRGGEVWRGIFPISSKVGFMNPEAIDPAKDVTISSEQEYKALLRSLQRANRFNLLFVQCSPAEGQRLSERVEKDLPDKQVEVLSLKEPIANLYELVDALPNKNQIDVLFIQGLEHSLYEYEKSHLWQDPKERYSYSERGLPPILAHLNLDRERFYERFKFSLVFLVPLFALKYLIRRAPDFFDWRSGVFEFAMDSERLQQESLQAILEHRLRENSSTLSGDECRDRLLKVQALIEEPQQKDSQKARLLFEQARLLEISKDFEGAIASYDWVLSLQPEYPNSWYNRGLALIALGRYEEALASYNRSLALQPNYPKAWNNRGVVLFKLGRYQDAIISFTQSLALQSSDPFVIYNKACCYALWGKVDEAIENLQQAIALNPQFRDKAKTDPDFNGIRDDDRFQALVSDFVNSERSL
jgi:tetratricopeptide (TPR) repeat protein